MTNFTRGFRLHLPDDTILHGAEFPSGRVVIDRPEIGAFFAAVSLAVVTDEEFPGSRVERPTTTQET